MFGRRYNEGLHQAIEAKEGVKVAAREQDARHHHLPELFPPVRQAVRHDRHRPDRGGGVPRDLQAGRRRDPHQQARRSARTIRTRCTRTERGKFNAVIDADRSNATTRASPCWSARFPSRNPSSYPSMLKAQGHQARGAERQVPRERGGDRRAGRASRARSPSRPTWPAAARTSCSAATPNTMAQDRTAARAITPTS